MSMTRLTPEVIQTLSTRYGLGDEFRDFRGVTRRFSDEARLAILNAMKVDIDHDVIHPSSAAPLRLPAAIVCTQDELFVDLFLGSVASHGVINITVLTEAQTTMETALPVSKLPMQDDGRYRIPLPEVPPGYHQLQIAFNKQQSHSVLAVTPCHCYQSPVIASGHRLWGFSLQLYTLRSSSNWGMGDFADLIAVIKAAAPHGCALIGLNPLHSLRPADPSQVSPYSPSSRDFINVLYIAVTDVPEYAHCNEAQWWVANHQKQLAALRDTTHVEYAQVAQCKFTVLSMLYGEFCKTHLAHNTARAAAFQQFIRQQGESLRLKALYDTLDQYFSKNPETNWGWRSWPAEFQNPGSEQVQAFAAEHARQVEYFMYLQWLAATQLQAAQQAAVDAGMQLGLYGDVAVGVDANGSEVWAHRDVYVSNISVGAPPDPLALKGQDWGIPPQHPLVLQKQAYAPFIRMLRANMRAAGALRLDHVMSLCRLWWVPHGMPATEGVYVHYPLEDLIKLVALESVRNQCVVIGEDLGVVPDVVRRILTQFQVYRYKVTFFEKLHDGQFIPPQDYPRNALAAVTTHDLPSLKAWWNNDDIRLSESLHHYPDQETQQRVQQERDADRHQLMHALVRAGLWHWQPHESLPAYSHALMRAIYLYAAMSNAALLVVQPEDLLYMIDPVNVPGTFAEYRNWSRKLTGDLCELLKQPDTREVLQALNKARRGANPNS